MSDFRMSYERKLRNQCKKVNGWLERGKTVLYDGDKVITVVFESFRVSDFGTSEAYVITEDKKRWNAGSQVFNLVAE